MFYTATGTSSANTAKTTTITKKAGRDLYLRHLTVTTKGADIAGDIDIVINDNAVAKYPVALRSGAVYGINMNFGDPGIPINDGDCTIVVDAGGANVVTVTSAIYEIR